MQPMLMYNQHDPRLSADNLPLETEAINADVMVMSRYGTHVIAVIYGMMTSSKGNIFRVTGHLCGEFTGPR